MPLTLTLSRSTGRGDRIWSPWVFDCPSIFPPLAARISAMEDLKQYVETVGKNARRAAQQLATVSGATKIAALNRIAAAIRANKQQLIDANAKDIAAAQKAELAPALIE